MRLVYSLPFAAALLAATPAMAQDNNAATDNAAATQAVDANAVPPQAVPEPTAQPADMAAPEPTKSRGLPWGAIGLIGLVGLLGARKAKG